MLRRAQAGGASGAGSAWQGLRSALQGAFAGLPGAQQLVSDPTCEQHASILSSGRERTRDGSRLTARVVVVCFEVVGRQLTVGPFERGSFPGACVSPPP